ncbi:MAG: undecaprenyl/decaprenyl-phosphate alpha-N-acetylglucosaminyl 1-phosphate transferase [Candidatus Brocadiia bacterium]|nr:MAG: undecaprenyl/decaprenyl-phosphate alpha-N-acetylglucosaminyl 1-phosphate transferase [Candidatus Brocadiia bacterium]
MMMRSGFSPKDRKMQLDKILNELFGSLIGSKRPIGWVFHFWPVFVTSFIAALGSTWLCKKIAIKFGIVDKPDNLVKTHKEPIAYLGGLGIMIGLTVGILTGLFYLKNEEFFRVQLTWLLAILAGAAVACFVGLTDDILDIKPRQKMLGQAAAAAILIAAGIVPNLRATTDSLKIPLPHSLEVILQILVVIFFVLGATNSLNLLDGLDGLCGGATVIITIAMLFLATHLATWGSSAVGDPVRIIICLGLVGGVFGFLPFNRHPAKIFMGDAGSLLLGFSVAALMILFAEDIPRWWMASIVVFGLPILDTSTALVRRLLNKRSLFVSDRGHIYDQMIDRGIPQKKTVKICYLLAIMYAAIGVVMSQIRTRYAAVVYIAVIIISAMMIWKKGYLKMEGLRGAVHKKNTPPQD